MKKSVITIVALFLVGALLLGCGMWGKLTEFTPDTETLAVLVDEYFAEEPEKEGGVLRQYRNTYQYVVDGKAYFISEEGKSNVNVPDDELRIFFDRNDPSRALFYFDMPNKNSYLSLLVGGGLALTLALVWLIGLLYKAGCFDSALQKLGQIRQHTKHIVIGVILAVVFAAGVVAAVYNGVQYVRLAGASASGSLKTAPGYIESVTPVKDGDNEYDVVLKYIVNSEKYFTEIRVQEFRELKPLVYYCDVEFFENDPHGAWRYDGYTHSRELGILGLRILCSLIAAGVCAAIVFGWLSATRRLAAIAARAKELAFGAELLAGGLAIIWTFTGNFDIIPLFDKIGAFVLVPLVLIAAGVIKLITAAIFAPSEKEPV